MATGKGIFKKKLGVKGFSKKYYGVPGFSKGFLKKNMLQKDFQRDFLP